MSAIFSMRTGQVGRVTLPANNVVPFTIDFEDARNGAFIVTSVGIRMDVNAQFLHTLDDAIYIYVFGDRVGDLVISGLAFIESCQGKDTKSGVAAAVEYYANNRASSPTRTTPVLAKLGPITIQAYLLGANLELLRPDTGAVQFTFNFKLLPPRTRLNPTALR